MNFQITQTSAKNIPNIDFVAIANACGRVLQLEGAAAVELVFNSKVQMQKLNFETRAKDKSTDVLSFLFLDELKEVANPDKFKVFSKKSYPLDYQDDVSAVFLGSIVICSSVAKKQAKEYNHSVEREIGYLFVHGLLHLLGYDHELGEKEKQEMRKLEEKILAFSER